MKTTARFIISAFGMVLIFIGVTSFAGLNRTARFQDQAIVYPADVKTVIDNKCYGCHSIKGTNEDAREALMWDSLPNLAIGRQIHSLDEIVEVLDDGSMPPKMAVQRNPSMAMTADEVKILRDWAETTADQLLNNRNSQQ